MRKVSDLMLDLGFREDSAQSTKEAFIKNLMKAAYGISIQTPAMKKDLARTGRHELQFGADSKQQLSFEFVYSDKKNSA